MTPAGSKTKGRNFENEVVEYLQAAGWPHVERRRLAGCSDRGDIAGIPGLVIEAKHERTYKLPQWLREAEVEKLNDNAHLGVVWARQNGKPGAGNGFIIMSPQQFVMMLTELGYAPACVSR